MNSLYTSGVDWRFLVTVVINKRKGEVSQAEAHWVALIAVFVSVS